MSIMQTVFYNPELGHNEDRGAGRVPLEATDGVLVEGEMEDVGCVNDGLVGSGMYMVIP